jgi:two-component system response regulator FixJ
MQAADFPRMMSPEELKVYIVDDDVDICDTLARLFVCEGLASQSFASARELLDACQPGADMHGCVLLDVNLPDMTGIELQKILRERGIDMPVVFLTGYGDVSSSSQAFRRGAVDFLEKPVDKDILLDRVMEAFAAYRRQYGQRQHRAALRELGARLTSREREVMRLVAKGHSSKQIAKDLSISHRTVEVYRSKVMEKMRAKTLADLISAALLMGLDGAGDNAG